MRWALLLHDGMYSVTGGVYHETPQAWGENGYGEVGVRRGVRGCNLGISVYHLFPRLSPVELRYFAL